MMKKEYLTLSPSQTRKVARELAEYVLQGYPHFDKAVIIALIGGLGSGKTTFLQGFGQFLGAKLRILSPTFVIERKIPLRNNRYKNLYHFDCYRLNSPSDIISLGWNDIVKNPSNIIALEWADRAKFILSSRVIVLRFTFINQNTRKIKIYYGK